MTTPSDDLEAVRVVAEALRGFDARDQERIIRWAREKLGLVALPAAPPVSAASKQPAPASPSEPPPPPPAPALPVRNLRMVERPVVAAPEVQAPEAEQAVAAQPEAGQAEVQPSEEQPEAVNILMPAPEQKNRAFTVIAIILLGVAVLFLIVMIVYRGR